MSSNIISPLQPFATRCWVNTCFLETSLSSMSDVWQMGIVPVPCWGNREPFGSLWWDTQPGDSSLTFLILLYFRFGCESIHSLAVVFPFSWVWFGGAGVFKNTHSRPYNNFSWSQDLDFLTLINCSFHHISLLWSARCRIKGNCFQERTQAIDNGQRKTRAHRLLNNSFSPQKEAPSQWNVFPWNTSMPYLVNGGWHVLGCPIAGMLQCLGYYIC